MMHRFSVGDRVRWKSASGGYVKEKHGVVVCIVPKGEKASTYATQCAEEMGMKYPDFGFGLPREHDSYIVHVPGMTPRGKGKLYFPLVQKLENDDDAQNH